MSLTRYTWLDSVTASDLPDGAKVVAAYLFLRADNATLSCHPKQGTIAKATGRSARSVVRSIQQLADAGFLVVVRADAYATNCYTLQVTPVSPHQVTPVSHGPSDSSVTSPSDSSVTSPSDSSVTSSKQAKEQAKEQASGGGGLRGILEELGLARKWHFQQIEQVEAEWRIADPAGWESALREECVGLLEHKDKGVRYWMTALKRKATEHRPIQKVEKATYSREVVR